MYFYTSISPLQKCYAVLYANTKQCFNNPFIVSTLVSLHNYLLYLLNPKCLLAISKSKYLLHELNPPPWSQ